MNTMEIKLLECGFQGDTSSLRRAHEATLNDYASRGWRVVASVMIYQNCVIFTLERPNACG